MVFEVSIDEAQRQFPHYKIHERLTPSAYKAAFRATGPDDVEVCLKIVRPDSTADRLDREILAMTKLAHPNVGKLIRYAKTIGSSPHYYIIEEFVDGSDLQASLRNVAWPIARVCRVFVPLLGALQTIGEARLVHRDLKPTNVRLRQDDQPVVINFGMVRHLDLPALTGTAAGARLGTPLYFAPEQFRGTRDDIDHRTDIFAAGLLLYEAAVGRHPFKAPGENVTLDEIEERVCDGAGHLEVPGFESLDGGLQLVLTKMLSRHRADRFAEAQQAARMLERIGGTHA